MAKPKTPMTPEMRALKLAVIRAEGAFDFASNLFDHARVTLNLARKAVKELEGKEGTSA